MNRNGAIDLARAHALAHGQDHAYLPTTDAEAAEWLPHAWVVDAIVSAAAPTGAAQADAGPECSTCRHAALKEAQYPCSACVPYAPARPLWEAAAQAAGEVPLDSVTQMRLTLVNQVHELIDIAERYARHMHKHGDAEERDRIQGAIDFATKKMAPYNYNGRAIPPAAPSAEAPMPEPARAAAAVTADRAEQVVKLQVGRDGVWAHFRVGKGYAYSVNLSADRMSKRFADEYAASVGGIQAGE